jgi:hypothetical protein
MTRLSWLGLLPLLVLAQTLACQSGGGQNHNPPDSSVGPVPEGGCLQASDCPSGSHCDCGFLNVNFATPSCESAGRCVTALASCDPKQPDTVLCDTDGTCPLGGTCGSDGFCSSPCPLPEGGVDAGNDASSDASDGGSDAETTDGETTDAESEDAGDGG